MALKDVLIDELRDLYSAENQLVKSMPKLAKGAEDKELKQLMKQHGEETKGQVQRLREVFEHIGKKPTGKHCEGMEGVIKEGLEALEEDEEGASFDAGILGAALRTEHYEVAGYQTAISMAKSLGMKDVVELLKQSLAEEVEMAKQIQAHAKGIFKQAAGEAEHDEDSRPSAKKSAKDAESERKSKDDERAAKTEKKDTKSKGAKGTSELSGTDSEQ